MVYVASKYFAAIGGAYSMESSQLSDSLYESLNSKLDFIKCLQCQDLNLTAPASATEQKGGYYEENKNTLGDSGKILNFIVSNLFYL